MKRILQCVQTLLAVHATQPDDSTLEGNLLIARFHNLQVHDPKALQPVCR
jgi:hypothetical protein